ncbi:MAG: glycerol-3-phosphate 1-O-acyltransferase PlsB [Gammaproteobacteria bacterium]|nr:glycerol-3-phosphate 1-O-acyltransferase PlsB [Gammaproteobacteria bacterium]
MRTSDLRYRFIQRLLTRLVQPQVTGLENLPAGCDPIYVLLNRSLTDIALLEQICTQHGLPVPDRPVSVGTATERRRYLFLHRPAGLLQRNTMLAYSKLMHRLLTHPDAATSPVLLVPVNILWSRAPMREHSWWRLMVSEAWAVTGRMKRMLNLFMNRGGIVVQFGTPLPLSQAADPLLDESVRLRRMARLLRVRLRNQRRAVLGPDLSHRRTLVHQIATSRSVSAAIESQSQGDARKRAVLEAKTKKMAHTIASDMSWPTIRVLAKLLDWFWTRIYDGVVLKGLDRALQVAEDHTLVYVPSHRSHLDYLLLSWLLYQRGLMLPHIAAGDNLNIPVLGPILRRGGAFFLRRKFGDDAVYRCLFEEYLYQVYRRGHSVEYFPEGGRSRTGRLLPARSGLLRMTLQSHRRGLPKPVAFVPVYIGYEKLVEAATYLDELRGGSKQRESMFDVFRSLRLIRQRFGTVRVLLGEPLALETWLASQTAEAGDEPQSDAALAQRLGNQLLQRINHNAHVNVVNLIALVVLATPRLAIEEQVLNRQVQITLDLLRFSGYDTITWDDSASAAAVERLKLITIETHHHDRIIAADSLSAILLTWYRNNTVHTLALPSLLACLLVNRRRAIALSSLQQITETIWPYIATELCLPQQAQSIEPILDRMIGLRIVCRDGSGQLEPPASESVEHQHLHLLAQVVMPSLERLFIILGLLTRTAPGMTRKALQTESQQIARRLSRLYGLNAPEFFDATLFNQFVDQMLKRDAIAEDASGFLVPSELARQVARTAGTVINAEFLRAVHRS